MTDYEVFELGDIDLQSGLKLPNAKLAYKTYGELNPRRDNVIVFPTFYSSDHTANEPMIGSGMALDPQEYFIIVAQPLRQRLFIVSKQHSPTPRQSGVSRYHLLRQHNVPAPLGDREVRRRAYRLGMRLLHGRATVLSLGRAVSGIW